MRKNVLIWLSVLFAQVTVFSFNAHATTGTVQIGSGSLYNIETDYPTPYGTYYKNHRVQYLYLANELSAVGLAAGNITELAFNVQAVNTCSPMPNFTIKAKLTTTSSLTTTFDNADYTTVYTNASFLPVAGWNTHVLSTPIYWDGISNLLVDICFDLVTDYTENASVYYTTTLNNLTCFYRSDSQIACGTSNAETTSTDRANIKITGNLATCLPPATLSVSNILSSSATISWTSTASQYQLEYGTQGFTLGTGTRITDIASSNYPLTGLNPATNYQAYVRAVCGAGDTSNWTTISFTTTQEPATFPYFINFESGTDQWSTLNGSQTNQWAYGTATANSGTHSMYISDDNGISHNYNISSSSVVHFYRDVTIPGSSFPKMLDFSWKGQGESGYDYLKVYMIPTSQVPVSGTQLTATQLGGTYNLQSTWQNASIQLPDSIAGKTKRFVFSWRNDGSSGTQPPAALDDIHFYILTCPKPTALTITGITQNSATVNWTSTASQFQLEYGTQGFTLGTGTRITDIASSNYPLTGLNPAINYQVYVRAVCGAGDTSNWTSISFSTLQVPATLPYFINFESGTEQWTVLNGSATNQWHYGTATAYSGTHSMYISDDNGATNNYDVASSSVVHIYRDVTIPVTTNPKRLDFSWKGQGESSYDYLKVYMIPTSQVPVSGTQLTATQLGGTYNLQSSWQNASIQLPDSIAGKTKRFVFSWRNDGGSGTQPPAALDDISFYILTCPKPTSLTANSITQNSASLGWTAGGSETQWQVQYGLQGFLLGSGTNQLATTNPVTVSGLTSGTYYSFYVRAICGAGDTSTWAGPFNFVTLCGPTTVTYIQNFDNPIPPAIPVCWDTIVLSSSGTPNIQTITTNPYSAPNCVQLFNSTASGSTTHILLITPQFSDLPSHTTQITFKAKFSGTGSPVLYVGTMIDPNNPGTFSNFKTITTINTTWQEFTVKFDTYSGTNQYIAFKHGLSTSNQYFYIDNVSYEPIPTCSKPQNLTVSNISGNGATISWTAGGSETSWDIEYGPSGFAHGTGTVIQNVSTTTYTFATLNPTTTYDVYVSAQCLPTDSSAWFGPVTFTTPQIPTTLPYTWNFENDFFNWSVVNGSQTNKWVTGTATYSSPTKSAYISNDNGTSNNYNGTVVSVSHIYRDVQFPAGSEFVMLFKWKGVGESSHDYMRIFLNNTTFTPVAGTLPSTGQIGKTYYNQNSTWKTDTILFNSSVSNSLKRLIFTWNNDGSVANQPPIAIDDINIYAITCARPTNLTATNITPGAADLGWTSQGSETQWQIQYGLQGFTLGSGTSQLVNTNPVTVSGFSSGMNYSFYVRAICGAGDTSFWAGPYTFYIPCNASIATYTQNFDGVTTPELPICWSSKVVASSIYAAVETSTSTPSSSPNCVYLYNSSAIGTSTHILLVTPSFSDLTSHLNRIRFNLKGTTTEKLIVGTMSNPADENTFVPFDTLSIPSSSLWTQETVSFLSYQGTNTFIAFKHAATTTYSDIYIDDFVYEPLPTVDLAVTKITQPTNGCGLTNAESITVKIKNMAINAFTNFHVTYKINNNPAISPETVNATLNPGDSMIYQFNTTADLSLPGSYTITSYICEATDQDHTNDTAHSQIISSPIISTFPYIDDFEVNSGAWIAGGVNSSWQWGTPAGSVINTAASGTKAWVTNLTGNYNNSENSYVVSPCFDLSSISTPYVRIKRVVHTESSYDGAALQYSLNGGNTWTNVGTVGDQTNWYNDNSISGLSFAGSQEGWTGQQTSWVSSSHVLTGLGGQSSVKFRVVFGSDGSVNSYEGFAFDDFTIYQPVDVAIVSPVDGSTIQKCNLTSNETLSIWIKNVGASLVPAGEKIRTWYKVDSHTPVADTLTLASNLMPNDSILYTFPQHYDFSALTTYVVSYWIKYGADINTSNDTSITTLVHFNLTVNISGGDTVCIDHLFLPYTLTLQAGPYPYDTYTWSNASGSLTGHNSMFDAPSFGWYFVTVTNGSCTASDSIFVCDITNIPEVTSPEINVYPSPATVQLNVSATSIPVDNYLLQLTTMDGKMIIQKSFYHTDMINTIIPTVKLLEGIYVLSITNSRNTWKFKVVH